MGDEGLPVKALVVSPYTDQGVDTYVKHHVAGSFDIQEILGRREEELGEVTWRNEELTGRNVSLQDGSEAHDKACEVQLPVQLQQSLGLVENALFKIFTKPPKDSFARGDRSFHFVGKLMPRAGYDDLHTQLFCVGGVAEQRSEGRVVVCQDESWSPELHSKACKCLFDTGSLTILHNDEGDIPRGHTLGYEDAHREGSLSSGSRMLYAVHT